MTEHFHVHGPHDHELEHAAHNAHLDPFSGRIAVTTAILATVAALCSYQGGASQANSTRHMSTAAIIKTEAANRWDRYQITNNRQHLAETGTYGQQRQSRVIPSPKRNATRRNAGRPNRRRAA